MFCPNARSGLPLKYKQLFSALVIVVSTFSATRIESYDESCATVAVVMFVQENIDMHIRSRMFLIKWLVTLKCTQLRRDLQVRKLKLRQIDCGKEV